MKIINNKNILMLLIFLTIAMVGFFAYYTYIHYNEYVKTQKSIKNISFIENMDNLSSKIMQERLYSAVYMAKKGEEGLPQVEKSRSSVDNAIADTYTYLRQNKVFMTHEKRIQFIEKSLKHVRTNVDTLSEDYRKVFFSAYHKEIISSLIDAMKIVISQDTSKETSDYKSMYKSLSELKENIALENTSISFILSASKAMDDEDYKTWDQLLSSQLLPDFSALKNKKLILELSTVFTANDFNRLVLDERVQIFNDSRRGKYSITNDTWSEKMLKKTKIIMDAQGILLKAVQKNVNDLLSLKKESLIQYAVGLLVSLLLFIVLFTIYYNINKDKQLFEDTLKDIEAVLNIDQQKELKFLIDNRETNQIYKFLTDTIKEANETKDLFLANMSHEIRTPLNGIVGFTQLLKSTQVSAEQEEFITVIEHSSENLLTIVNDILDFSKIRANQVELENIPFDPLESFESAIESYGARAAEKDIHFNVYVDPSLPMVLIGDPTKISQILVNLLSNAIKFTDMAGHVNVSIENKNETDSNLTLKFSVQDTGIGITDEQKDKIFNEFSQADASTSRKFGGTGLGLAIASKFVSIMGGQLEIESAKGKGATFYFTLTLDKNEKSIPRSIEDKNDIKVGYLVPNKNIDNIMKTSLEDYVQYLGAGFIIYEGKDLLTLAKSDLPDILFINHQYCNFDNELEQYLKLDTKIVLVTTGRLKSKVLDLEDDIDKIFYQPINFTKTYKSFDILKPQKSLEINDVLITDTSKQFKNIHALVVEDNLINQKLISRVLNGFGIEVSVANNGGDGVELRRQNQYDIIFMDIQMPVMGGIEATQKILEYEEQNRKHHIPIVALTANALHGDREKYLEAGMDDYTSKPINIDKLNEILHMYLDTNMKNDKQIQNVAEVEEKDTSNDVAKVIIKADILLYREMVLAANIYKIILNNLGYSVEIAIDEDTFMDKIEEYNYRYILFDKGLLGNSLCLMAEFIKEKGSVPLVFVSNQDSENDCCETISLELKGEAIKTKLNRVS